MGGKKRLRNGAVKGPETQAKSHKIQEAILELGGEEADIGLVNDALSASEIEDEGVSSRKSDGNLKRDLSQFVQELGFQGSKQATRSAPDGLQVQAKNKSTFGPLKPTYQPIKLLEPAVRSAAANDTRNSDVMSKRTGSDGLIFEQVAEWHAVTLPSISPKVSSKAMDLSLAQRLQEHAKSLLELENERYKDANDRSASSNQFYSTLVSSGTLSDKISVLTLSVQESPLHNVHALENLVNLARKRSRSQAVEVLGALKDLFASGSLLPSSRKLRTFITQPGLLSAISDLKGKDWTVGQQLPGALGDVHLVAWAFEDWLKARYFEIISIIETWSHDEISFARTKSVDYVYQLLREKPEQEDNLLRLLVNKLGDPEKKIASRASYNILQLQNSHPAMKRIIISSIEHDLLFRPKQNLHAQYYASITLNQTVLSSADTGVTTQLLNIYFSLFKQLLAKPEATDPRPIIVNLKGEIQGGGSAPGKAARKKAKALEKKAVVNEELKEKMISAILTGVNRAIPYTNTNDEFFEKHIDTLFRVTHSSNFNTAIQALILIQQIQGNNQKIVDRFYRTLYESLLDARLTNSSKQTLYLNLLFRALRDDLSVKRVKAFVKRLLQVIGGHQAPLACATLYLVRELEATFANLQDFADEVEEAESDREEHFHDVEEEARPHFNDVDEDKMGRMALPKDIEGQYDGKKRDPEFSNADRSSLWEISPLLMHFHPSVALFASRLLSHEPMPPKPDLAQNTLMHFLDRFVYRNPKQASTAPRGPSIMQPIASGNIHRIIVSERSGMQQPVNSESFTNLTDDKIKPDEVFFHRYFNADTKGQRARKEKLAKKRNATNDRGDEDGDEEEIWKALVSSKPELDEAEDIDVSLGMNDSNSELGFDGEDLAANSGEDEDDIAFNDIPGVGDGNDSLIGSESDVEFSGKEGQGRESGMEVNKVETPMRSSPDVKKKRRKKLKSLPTFASVEDYAAMLD